MNRTYGIASQEEEKKVKSQGKAGNSITLEEKSEHKNKLSCRTFHIYSMENMMAKINNKKKKSEPHMLDKKDVRCWSLSYYLNQAMMTSAVH